MINSLTLLKYAEEQDILVTFLDLNNRALSMPIGKEKYAIAVNRRARSSERETKACLAHELGHCETGSFYNVSSPLALRSRQEGRADRWAIRKLIPFTELVAAIRAGNHELWQLADYFEVPYDFMQKAIGLYEEALLEKFGCE